MGFTDSNVTNRDAAGGWGPELATKEDSFVFANEPLLLQPGSSTSANRDAAILPTRKNGFNCQNIF
jgi:hypothetical protein